MFVKCTLKGAFYVVFAYLKVSKNSDGCKVVFITDNGAKHTYALPMPQINGHVETLREVLKERWNLSEVEAKISLRQFIAVNPDGAIRLFLKDGGFSMDVDAALTHYLLSVIDTPMSEEEFNALFRKA